MKINMVKTDKVCYISDCDYLPGDYSYNYHRSQLTDILFDGKQPKETYLKNWLQIEKYPNKIQRYVNQPDINKRFELKNKEMESEKLPLIVKYKNKGDFDEDVIANLYIPKSDKQEPVLQDVECEFNILFEIQNYELPPTIDYSVLKKVGWDEKKVKITNVNIKHQLLDKMIFPEIVLSSRPCSISSHDLYCIVRQYIKDNIDNKVARITSDYDFCFTVKKIVPLLEPVKFTYQNYFARTKRERSKIHHAVQKEKEITIFEMTHDQRKYESYPVLPGISAESEHELKEKIDTFLADLIKTINKPLELCEHCNGSGYKDEPRIKD